MIRRFTPNDINKLFYNKTKKDITYFKKYEVLDSYKDGYIETLFKDHDYPRIPCILDFKEWINKYDIKPKKLFYTCEGDYELHYISPESKQLIEYDFNTNEGDLHKISLPEADFDFILINQTHEHLYNPLLATKNLYDHLTPGGWIFVGVPTINIPHLTPFHFQGIYPIGLTVLLESVGFDVKETGQWGNHNYIKFIFKNHTWPDHNQLKIAGNGIITNEDRNVAQCWALAQKPL
jgi:SAM-dependent methyltransferase